MIVCRPRAFISADPPLAPSFHSPFTLADPFVFSFLSSSFLFPNSYRPLHRHYHTSSSKASSSNPFDTNLPLLQLQTTAH